MGEYNRKNYVWECSLKKKKKNDILNFAAVKYIGAVGDPWTTKLGPRLEIK